MELYNRPANLFVAGFIGSPQMNFIEGSRLGESPATIGIRPEHISVDKERGTWKGSVMHAEHLGADTILYLDTEKAGFVTVRLFGEHRFGADDVLYATPDPARIYGFGADGRVVF
jgi:multiple sugar transport system ATP-binding protein